MREVGLIRNIRRLLSIALVLAQLPGCGRPEAPPVDPLELELFGLTVHERAALIMAAALPSRLGEGADQLRAEIATGAARAIVIRQSQLPGAAAELDSLRAGAPLPILVVVELDEAFPDAGHCRPERGKEPVLSTAMEPAGLAGCGLQSADPSLPLGRDGRTSEAAAAEAEEVVRTGEAAGRAVFAAGADMALIATPPVNRDDPLPPLALAGIAGVSWTRSYLEGLREAGLPVAVRALAVGDTLSAPLRWDRARLDAIEVPELAGFVEREIPAIELGGARLPALTGDSLPLPLSSAAVGGLLRRDLAFDGVVMADLSGASLAVRGRGMPAAAVDALTAGVDFLLGVEAPAAAVDAIAEAVEEGRLAPGRLEEATRRVMRLRETVGLADSVRLERRRNARAALASAAAAVGSRVSSSGAAGPRPGESVAAAGGVDDEGGVDEEAGAAGAGADEEGGVAAGAGAAAAEASVGVADSAAFPRAPILRVVPPDSVGMAASARTRIDAIMREALEDSVFSGAAVAVGRRGGLVLLRGYGRSGRNGEGEPVDPRATIFDIASLTKVVGTTTAAALLVDDGRMELDAPVERYLPGFDGDGKEDVLIRHLLTHTSGLPSGIWVFGSAGSPGEALRQILEEPLVREPGERMEYSDLGMILLAEAVERAAEMPIDRFLARRVFAPLGMQSTMYLPPLLLHEGIVPTAELTERNFPLQGIVHDANSFRLGGIAGHAGLFSTARDLAVFAQTMLNGGRYGAASILSPATVATFTRRQPGAEQRALGWDTPSRVSSAGAYFSARSFGHTGYTGTSLWMDPQSGLFVVLLTNRTYVKASAREILRLRAAVHDAAARAITDQPVRRR